MICNKLIPLDAPTQFGRPQKRVWGAVAAAGAATLGSILSYMSNSNTNIANANLNRENRAWNEKIMDKQNEWNIEQRNYNSAEQQVARLQAAGLNPYLMMNGGAGTASNLTSASPGTANMSNPAIPTDYSSLGNVGNAIGSLIQNEDLVRAQTRATNAQAFTSEINNKTQDVRNTWEIGKLINEGKDKAASAAFNQFRTEQGYALLGGQIMNQSIQNDYLAQQKVQSAAQTDCLRYEAALSSANLRYLPQQQKAELAKYAAETYAAYKQGLCSQKQADLLVEAKVGQTLDNDLKKHSIGQQKYIASRLSYEFLKAKREAEKAKWDAEHSKNNRGSDDLFKLANMNNNAPWFNFLEGVRRFVPMVPL